VATTRIDWDHMTAMMNVLDAQSGLAHDQQKTVTGMKEEAMAAWTGKAGTTWVAAVEDWLSAFNDVLAQLDTITHQLDTEVKAHIDTEGRNLQTAGHS